MDLTRYLDDGRIDLDSNIVERSMRPQALTRMHSSPATTTARKTGPSSLR
jgi:hypothetical protein